MKDFIDSLQETIGSRETLAAQARVQAEQQAELAERRRQAEESSGLRAKPAQRKPAYQTPELKLQAETAQYLREGFFKAAQFLVEQGVQPHIYFGTCVKELVRYRFLPLYHDKHTYTGTKSWIIEDRSSSWFTGNSNPMDSNNGGSGASFGYANYLLLLETEGNIDRVQTDRGRKIVRPYDSLVVSKNDLRRFNTEQDNNFLVPLDTVVVGQPIELNPRVAYFLGRIADIAMGNREPEIIAK